VGGSDEGGQSKKAKRGAMGKVEEDIESSDNANSTTLEASTSNLP
jgi:hypothetical protein